MMDLWRVYVMPPMILSLESWNRGITSGPWLLYIYAMKIMFNWRTMAFWLYNYILVNDSYPVRWPMAIWQEPPWTKIASGKSDQSQRFRTEGANLGISQPPKKKQKTNHWDDRNDAEDFCFIFFSGQWSHDKKDDTYNSARCVNT